MLCDFMVSKLHTTFSMYFQNLNCDLLVHVFRHFQPITSNMYLLQILIASLCCFYLLRLARAINFGFVIMTLNQKLTKLLYLCQVTEHFHGQPGSAMVLLDLLQMFTYIQYFFNYIFLFLHQWSKPQGYLIDVQMSEQSLGTFLEPTYL